jgi:hypothetical protein
MDTVCYDCVNNTPVLRDPNCLLMFQNDVTFKLFLDTFGSLPIPPK